MLKIVNYRCGLCDTDTELVIYKDEDAPDTIECEACRATAYKFNLKNNSQRWRFADQ
jgi:hypothetical protein